MVSEEREVLCDSQISNLGNLTDNNVINRNQLERSNKQLSETGSGVEEGCTGWR
jgi:hypothetical protein